MTRTTISLVFAFVITTACAARHERSRDKVITPVRVRLVDERTQLASARYSGTVEPGTRVDVAFKVGGYVRACDFPAPGAVPGAFASR